MDHEALKELVTATTRKEIVRQVNAPRTPMNEGIVVALVAAAGIAIGVAMDKYFKDKELKDFIDDNIPNYEVETNTIFRRFSYVKSLADLDKLEKEVDGYVAKLDNLQTVVSDMKADTKDGQHIRNTAKTVNTWRTKKSLSAFVSSMQSAFKNEIKERRRKMDAAQ